MLLSWGLSGPCIARQRSHHRAWGRSNGHERAHLLASSTAALSHCVPAACAAHPSSLPTDCAQQPCTRGGGACSQREGGGGADASAVQQLWRQARQ